MKRKTVLIVSGTAGILTGIGAFIAGWYLGYGAGKKSRQAFVDYFHENMSKNERD